ncbi:hypothetical protein EKK58_03990 [Candidatus Dependentiae bacterium]|nr:MAG: hypothetical protein EKK58_03990 [Candidatus Dependentiae bacterium]
MIIVLINMFFNKKYIQFFFVIYGSLLLGQDTKGMTPSTVSTAAKKTLAHIYGLPKPIYLHQNKKKSFTSKTLSHPVPTEERSPLVYFLEQVAYFNSPIALSPKNNFDPSLLLPSNNPPKCLMTTQTLDKNNVMLTQKDVEKVVNLLYLIHNMQNNNLSLTLIYDESDKPISGTCFYPAENALPLSKKSRRNPEIKMNLHISRIKSLPYYHVDIIEKIIKEKACLVQQYTKTNNTLNNRMKILQDNLCQTEKEKKVLANTNVALQKIVEQEQEEKKKLQNNLEIQNQTLDQLNKYNNNQTREIDLLKKKLNTFKTMLSEVKNRLEEKENEVTSIQKELIEKQETSKQEKEKLTEDYSSLEKKYEEQIGLLKHIVEEHIKLTASFETIKKLIDDDKKEEIESLKNELINFQKSLQEMQIEDKKLLKKIDAEKRNIENQHESTLQILHKTYNNKIAFNAEYYKTCLSEKDNTIENLNDTNTQLQNNNNWLKNGLGIVLILLFIENIYYKNKIAKLTNLLHT